MTSIRSMSARGTSCTSQNTPENNGVYTVRPSISTRSLLAVVPLKPRALMAHWRESICATCRFAARRSASARLAAPERRMSSCVITWIAEAVCDSRSGRFDTDVTCRFINCSMLNFFRASADKLASLSGGRALAQKFPNHLEQLTWFERLDQRARRAQRRRGLQHLDLSGPAPTRHGDDRRLGMLGTKGADHFQPVPLGHEDVHQNKIGTLLALQAQPGVPIGCFQHLVASRLERDSNRPPKHAIIIHHEDSRHALST